MDGWMDGWMHGCIGWGGCMDVLDEVDGIWYMLAHVAGRHCIVYCDMLAVSVHVQVFMALRLVLGLGVVPRVRVSGLSRYCSEIFQCLQLLLCTRGVDMQRSTKCRE